MTRIAGKSGLWSGSSTFIVIATGSSLGGVGKLGGVVGPGTFGVMTGAAGAGFGAGGGAVGLGGAGGGVTGFGGIGGGEGTGFGA